MKKIFNYVLTILMVLSVFTFLYTDTHLAYADSDTNDKKLIYEADFEEGDFNGWHVMGDGRLELDQQNAFNGNISVKIQGRVVSWNGPVLTTTSYLIPNKKYTISGYVFHSSNTAETIHYSLKTTTKDGITLFNNIHSVTCEPNVWTLISGEIVIPENTATSEIYFESPNPSLSFNIDNTSIEGDTESANAVSLMSSQEKTEFHFNFENGMESWIPRGETTLDRADSYSISGKYSIHVSSRTETWHGASVSIDSISRGTSYLYSAYIMYTGKEFSDTHTFLIQIQYDYGGSIVYEVIQRKEIQKNTWSIIEGEYTLPVEAKNIIFYIQTEQVSSVMATNDDLMPFYVDCVEIIDSTLINKQKTTRLVINIITTVFIALVLILIIILIIKSHIKTKTALTLASKDAMTKALNRNTYEKRIASLEKNPLECKSLYIAVCDVNFLKYLNDNYGHKEGDSAIIRCAQSLITAVGKKGFVYRTGGDEFVCIANVPIKKEINQQLALEARKYHGYPFSVAVGFSEFNKSLDGDIPDIKLLISRADNDMYLNKESIKKRYPEYARKA